MFDFKLINLFMDKGSEKIGKKNCNTISKLARAWKQRSSVIEIRKKRDRLLKKLEKSLVKNFEEKSEVWNDFDFF
jgi:hypothetical protein